jgi:hypothetical protein
VNIAGVTKSSRATNHIGRTDGRPFPLPSVAEISLPQLPHIKTCDTPRRSAMKRDLDHCDLIPLVRRTNRLPDCGTRADKSTTAWMRRERFWRMSTDDFASGVARAMRVANSDELTANDLPTAATRTLVRALSIIGASVAT